MEKYSDYVIPGAGISTAYDELLANALGVVVLNLMKKDEVLKAAIAAAESQAMNALEDIRQVLDDDTLEDPECFHRIEAILKVLEKNGIYTTRHDF